MEIPEIIRPAIWSDCEMITAGFTTRVAGRRDLSPAENLRNICLPGGDDVQVAYLKQVHSDKVVVADAPGYAGEADGLVTTRPGITLAIQVADCAVVLLADRGRGIVAADHSGWRGTAALITTKVVEKMKELGSHPEDVEAFVGPCISSQAYEVGEEVASRFDEAFVYRKGFRKPHLDIRAALKSQLISAGVQETAIQIDQRCTWQNPQLFYSYRREGAGSGRMIGFIRWNSDLV